VQAPRSDHDIPAFWRGLGLPGLVDVHTHFMPEQVLTKVWAHFDRIRDRQGGPGWPIRYRLPETDRIAVLRRAGVRTFTGLLYPHKPGMAAWLNRWAAAFAARTPGCVHTATLYAEEEADGYVAEALEAGARVFKVHLAVGRFDPRAAVLRPVWRRLAEARVPVVVHAGSGPEPGPFTGPEPFAGVLAEHPGLVAVIAHMGLPEYAEFLGMALRYESVHLDTTMVFTDFTQAAWPYPPGLLGVLAEHPRRVVLGTDFPNVPHTYAHQLEALARLGLGADWLRAVCHDNGARLLGTA
jgi:uncharacterized protein